MFYKGVKSLQCGSRAKVGWVRGRGGQGNHWFRWVHVGSSSVSGGKVRSIERLLEILNERMSERLIKMLSKSVIVLVKG